MSTSHVSSQYLPVTPLEMYLRLVQGTFDAIRAQNNSQTYVPAQFGGIVGQGLIPNNGSVMQFTSFEVN